MKISRLENFYAAVWLLGCLKMIMRKKSFYSVVAKTLLVVRKRFKDGKTLAQRPSVIII